ncbi:MAG TPA: hypothetical protein VOA88_08425 [Candidatus Dormibacteraeota bacterium]|nr:hypothetical protein [Candidatus Dormibacteraeota bacterium]
MFKAQQARQDNARADQQIQFESVRAADSHVAALNAARAADNADAVSKEAQAEWDQSMQDYLARTGVKPALSISADNESSMHAQAIGGLKTLAAANGGTVPAVQTTNNPQGAGADQDNHSISVYAATPQTMARLQADPTTTSVPKLVNDVRRAQGLQPYNDSDWKGLGVSARNTGIAGGSAGLSENQAAQKNAVDDALQFVNVPIKGLQPGNTAEEFTGKNQALLAQAQQQLATYKNSINVDPQFASLLQKRVDTLQDAIRMGASNISSAKAAANTATAPSEALAAGLKEQAKEIASQPFKQAQAKFEQSLKDGDPDSAGALLAQGLVAPSQIISSRQPAFAQKAFAAADAYTQKATGQRFNAQSQEGYFKSAQSQGNVSFFGSAKSLNDKGGTLDQLQQQFNALGNSKLPALNSLENWKAAASGSGPIAGFAQTAIGVADDYAKVMGGGQGSDTSRKQVLDSFSAAKSPDQMAASITAARKAVDSQMVGRIGTNPVMRNMYGDQLLTSVTAPDGSVHMFRDAQSAANFKKMAGIQ